MWNPCVNRESLRTDGDKAYPNTAPLTINIHEISGSSIMHTWKCISYPRTKPPRYGKTISLRVQVTDEVSIATRTPSQTALRYLDSREAGVRAAKNKCAIKNVSNSPSTPGYGLTIPLSLNKKISTTETMTAPSVNCQWVESSSTNMFLCACSKRC